jgi:hypothetical protein
MKKALFLFFLIISTISSINAEENEFSLQLASFVSGASFSGQQFNGEFSIDFFNIFFETYRNIGFKVSPFSLREYYTDDGKNDYYEMNFLNFCLYWNLLNSKEKVLGPFCSLQYLSIVNWHNFDPFNITLNAGLIFIIKLDYYNFIGKNYIGEFEVGYRYNSHNGHQCYFNVRLDFLSTLVFIGKMGQRANSNRR